MVKHLPIPFILALILCGCGPGAKEIARQHAVEKFNEAVAAVKVCTQGSTYEEFREKRMALETCYIANESNLTNRIDRVNYFEELDLNATSADAIWQFEIASSDDRLDKNIRLDLSLISKECDELLAEKR